MISAKRRKIPIFHMEAGNRCFDQRVPEEINRKIVDHLSDINMPLSEHARKYLLAEGLRPETVIKTGSPMTEVLIYHKAEIEENDVLEKEGLKKGDYFIVSTHREENVDSEKNFSDLLSSLNAIVDKYHTSQYAEDADVIHSIPDYASDNVSKKVVRIILSYTDYINRTVWHKEI